MITMTIPVFYVCLYFALGFGAWLGWCLNHWDKPCDVFRLILLLTLWPFVIILSDKRA